MRRPAVIEESGHRIGMTWGEHRVEKALGCSGSICGSCGCCQHCEDCICPDGPCTNENCGCWIDDHYEKM